MTQVNAVSGSPRSPAQTAEGEEGRGSSLSADQQAPRDPKNLSEKKTEAEERRTK